MYIYIYIYIYRTQHVWEFYIDYSRTFNFSLIFLLCFTLWNTTTKQFDMEKLLFFLLTNLPHSLEQSGGFSF